MRDLIAAVSQGRVKMWINVYLRCVFRERTEHFGIVELDAALCNTIDTKMCVCVHVFYRPYRR